MKKYWMGILCALCVVLLTPAAFAAEPDVAELLAVSIASGPCGADNPENLIWTLNENGIMTFIGSGPMADYEYADGGTTAPWVSYRKQIKSVVIPDGVTRIGATAFCGSYGDVDYSFSALSSVTIANSVSAVGALAFCNCDALLEIDLPGSVREIGRDAFNHCSFLTSVTLPASVASIGYGAFKDCERLSELDVPASVAEIGEGAFAGCPNLTLTVQADSYARNYALENRVRHKVSGEETVYVAGGPCGAEEPYDLLWTLDESGNMTFTGSGAMADYQSSQLEDGDWNTNAPWIDRQEIKSVLVSEGVTRIGSFAFDGTGKYAFPELASVTIPASVESVGRLAFAHCHALTQVSLADGPREIGAWAFHFCGALPALTLPASVDSIGENAFAECPNLTLTVSENSYARRYALENTLRHKLADGGETVYVAGGPCGAENPYDLVWALDEGGNMTVTGSGAMPDYGWNGEDGHNATTAPWFDYRKQITSAVFSRGVTRIGKNAFYGWGDDQFSALASVTISDSVTSIGQGAFDNCDALTRIDIPGSVTELGVHAFCYIDSLTEAVLSEGLSKIGESAFEGCGNLSSLNVPASVEEIGADAFKLCPNLTLTVSENTPARRYALENTLRHKLDGGETVYVAGGPCGAENPYDLVWTLDEDGNMTFTGSGAMPDYTNYQPEDVESWTTEAPWVAYRTRVKTLTVSDGVTNIGAFAFYGSHPGTPGYDYTFSALASVEIADSVKEIGQYAFFECDALTRARFPDGVRTVGESTFAHCDALSEVALPASLTRIGTWAFTDCPALTGVDIPGNVAVIGAEAFAACKALSALTLPASVASIGENAFRDCPQLTLTVSENTPARRYALENTLRHKLADGGETVYVAGGPCGAENPYAIVWALDEDGNMTFTGSGAMSDYTYYQWEDDGPWTTAAPWFPYHSQIKSVTVSYGVTRIGSSAFYGSDNHNFPALSSVTLPNSVSSFGELAFCNCDALPGMELPRGLKVIEGNAFNHCDTLSALTLPLSVTSIGENAFKDCPQLTLTVYEGSYARRYALLNSVRHEAVEPPPVVYLPEIGNLSYVFANSHAGFGYPANYRVPYERYVAMFGDKVMTKFLFQTAGLWAGNCYGVSTSSALFFQKDNSISASAFRDGASVPLNLELSDSNGEWNLSLKEFIECMQVSQFSPDIQKSYLARKNQLSELCAAVTAFAESGDNPVVVAVFGPEGGHALLGYKLEKVSDTRSRLYVYDSNYPEDAARYLTIDTNAAGEYRNWYYPINDNIEWGSALPGCWISYIPYDDYFQVWRNRGGKGAKLELLTVNDNARIYDAEGMPVASIQDGELITGRDDMFPMIDVGITADGKAPENHGMSVWVPADMYTVKRVASKANGARLSAGTPFEASVTHMEQSAKVTTTAGSVLFAVDDESEINMVSIGDGQEGETYDITLSSTLESAENAEIRLTGTVLAKALTFMQVSGVARYSGITAENGSGVAAGTSLTIDGQQFELRAVTNSLPVMSFAPNGGAGNMSPTAAEEDGSLVMPACEFVPPDGMEFDGWTVNGWKYQPGDTCELTENASASARWKRAGVNVTPDAYAVRSVARAGQAFRVEVENVSGDGGTLFVAAYGKNGKFLRVVMESAQTAAIARGASGTVTVSLDMDGAEGVRAFVLDGATWKPLCEEKTYRVQ